MKILLTGANGMVGKNILEHQSAVSHHWLTPSSNELNLLEENAVEAYLQAVKPDMLIHCAGRVGGIQANIKSPYQFFIENLDMGRNVVFAAHKAGVKRLINLASSCIYPRNGHNPLKEESILTGQLEPTNEGYALAKVCVMRMCQYIHQEHPEFNYKTIIPCNLYGRWDKFDPKYSHMIPAVIRKIHEAATANHSHVEIWGDGTARREFMFAGDLADCIINALENFDKLPELMNTGLGKDYTINQYYQAIADVIGYQGEFVHDLSKPVGMKQKLVDIENQNTLDWHPKHSLKEGIQATYHFFLQDV